MVFCFALYPFTRGRARPVQVVLACAILFCIISLHTWSCTHCSCCPSVWYFFCIIYLHTWSCTHCSSCPSVWYFVLHYIPSHVVVHCSSCPSVWYFVLHYIPSHVVIHALFMLSERMIFCFALYSFSRGRARTVQVVLVYGILICFISLHTWSFTHCSCCPSVCYFVFSLYFFSRGRARTVQVVLAYGILFCIISLQTWSWTQCSCCPSVWYFVLHYIPSHVVVQALFKLF